MLGGDDLVDTLGGPLDLARLVGHDVVVVLLARQLDGGVPLADLEFVRGLGRPAAQALEQVLERRRDEEDEQGARYLALDDLRPLDVDLEDARPRPDMSASLTWLRGVPYQLPWTSLASRKPPAARSSAKASGVRKW